MPDQDPSFSPNTPSPDLEASQLEVAVIAQHEQLAVQLTSPDDELGTINFHELSRDLIIKPLTHGAIAVEGLRARISSRREGSAGDRMERMEHKDALYNDLGALAITGKRTVSPTASGREAMPRNFLERFIDKRMENRSYKKSFAAVEVYRAQKVFGDPGINSGLTRSERRNGKLGLTPAERIARPELVGTRALNESARKGQITARERRQITNRIGAVKVNHGALSHKLAGEQIAKTSKSLKRATTQPVSTIWRAARRNIAVEDIQQHHAKANKHRERQKKLRDRL